MDGAVSPEGFAWSEAQADARGRWARGAPAAVLAVFAGMADAAVVFVVSMAAILSRLTEPAVVHAVVAAALASILTVNALSLAGLYTGRLRSPFGAQARAALGAWSAVAGLLMVLVWFGGVASFSPRFWVGTAVWFGTVGLGLVVIRWFVVVKLRRWRERGLMASTMAVVDLAGGNGALARQMAQSQPDTFLLGVFSGNDTGPSGVADLVALSRLFRVDHIFVLVSSGDTAAADGRLAAILLRLGSIPTTVQLCTLLPGLSRLPTVTVHRRPLSGWGSVAKRTEDLVIGAALVLCLLPLMVFIAVAIKLDTRGPVLFRQARQGFNQNVFTVLKFRTMTDQASADGSVIQAKRDDRRVTRVGRVLRRTSLDELPQVFNVLRGEMSLVGPRPHAIVHNEQYAAVIDDYLGRHRVPPGITGWAQINGLRGETETMAKMQKRVEFDLAYIDRWSVALDLKIIVLTATSMLFDRHAY